MTSLLELVPDIYKVKFSSLIQDGSFKRKARKVRGLCSFEKSHENVKSLCFILGHFPNPYSGGAQRYFDLIKILSKNFKIYLFSGINILDEKQFLSFVSQYVQKMMVVDHRYFKGEHFLSWKEKENIHFDCEYYAWCNTLDILRTPRDFDSYRIFDFVECNTFRYANDLLKEGATEENLKQLAESYLEEMQCLESVDTCVAVTEEDKGFINKYLSQNTIKVIPTPLPEEILKNCNKRKNQSDENLVVTFFGNYYHTPNTEAVGWYLENIHDNILKVFPKYHFHIVGHGCLNSLKEKYENKVNIVWRGRVDSIEEELSLASLCVSPLFSGVGIRGKVNQYAAYGKAIVATSLSLNSLPYRDKESVFIANTPLDFQEALKELLLDKEKRERLGENARKLAIEHFSYGAIEEIAKKVIYATAK